MLVTQTASHTRQEHFREVDRDATDRDQPSEVRTFAEHELDAIREGGAVDPSYQSGDGLSPENCGLAVPAC